MFENKNSPIGLLEKLREQSKEFTSEKTLHDSVFCEWHTAIAILLRQYFPQDQIINSELEALTSAWVNQTALSIVRNSDAFLDPEKAVDNSFKNSPAAFREEAQRTMRGILQNLPVKRRRQMRELAPAVKEFEETKLTALREQRFQQTMKREQELLGKVIQLLKNNPNP